MLDPCEWISKANLFYGGLHCFILPVKSALQKFTSRAQAVLEPLNLKREFCFLAPSAAMLYIFTLYIHMQ